LTNRSIEKQRLSRFARGTTVRRLKDVRPQEFIDDDRIPDLLRKLNRPAFVTLDEGFWDRKLRDPHFCILYLAFRDDQQS